MFTTFEGEISRLMQKKKKDLSVNQTKKKKTTYVQVQSTRLIFNYILTGENAFNPYFIWIGCLELVIKSQRRSNTTEKDVLKLIKVRKTRDLT